MNRRNFLRTSLAAVGAMYLDLPAFAQKVRVMGPERLRIGIVSDIHITTTESAAVFKHTLEYFRDRLVDGVIIAGDMADQGLESQLKVVADTWYTVFPKDKLPNGQHIEKLFVYGNHDMEGYTYGAAKSMGLTEAQLKAMAVGANKEKMWKKYFKEDFKPIWLKTVKGYHFVGAHWHDWQNIPAVPGFLQQQAGKLSGDKPFFYIQHAHPRNTTYGEWAWGMDNGEVGQALSQFPNAVAFSGHSHMPLNDDRCLWQGAFTSIGTSSLSYVYPLGGRENSYEDGNPNKVPAQMPAMGGHDGKQGMIMTVYDEYITFERREFLYDELVADNWVLPIPKGNEAPMSFENRAKTAPVPQFAATDAVTVTQQQGKDRYGVEQKQWVVSFPTVLKKRTGTRANDYEVQIEYRYLDNTFITATKRVYSPKPYLGENHDEESVVCLYGISELPDFHEFRFVVRPCECYGKKGKPIYSDWMKK